MSALFDFSSLIMILLLSICSCTHIRSYRSTIFDSSGGPPGTHVGFRGGAWKLARIGERLSPAKEEFERGEIQYLALLSPGIKCPGWIESSKLAADAMKPFLHETERQAKECSKAVKANEFCQPSQRGMSLSLSSTRKDFKAKNVEFDKSTHHLTPSDDSMSITSPKQHLESASKHSKEALRLSQNSLVQQMCSEMHSLGDTLPLGSSPPTYLDVIWAVPPQSAASSSSVHYSAMDPRSLGLYGGLRHLIMKTGGMGGSYITIAEWCSRLTLLLHRHLQVRVNSVSGAETVMNPVWISWCSLLPAKVVWLDANVQYLPLERRPAWRGRLLACNRKGLKSLGNFSICTSDCKMPILLKPKGDFTLVRLVPWSTIMGSCHLLTEGPSASVFAGDMKAKGCIERLRMVGGEGLAAVVMMSDCGRAMAWRYDEHVGCVVAQLFISPDEICREAALCLLETREQEDRQKFSGEHMDRALQAITSLPILGETVACHTTTTTPMPDISSTEFSSPLIVDDLYNAGIPLQAEIGMYGIPGTGGLQSPEISCLRSGLCGFTEVSSHSVVDSGGSTLGEESSLGTIRTENAMKRTRSKTYNGSVASLLRPSLSQVGGRSGSSSLQRSASLPHKIRSSLLGGAGKRKGGKAAS